jgi:hypothetical protein
MPGVPLFLLLLTARGGPLAVNSTLHPTRDDWRPRLRCPGVAAVVCPIPGNDDLAVVKTGETAVVLNRD